MSTAAPNKYLNKARHNEAAYQGFCDTFPYDHPDWKVTMLFYTAHHYMHALFYSRGDYFGDSHEKTKRCLSNPDNGIPKSVQRDYAKLLGNCHTARYDGLTSFENFDSICESLLADSERYFYRMKDFAESQMKVGAYSEAES